MASNIYHISSTSLVELRRTRERIAQLELQATLLRRLTYSEISIDQQRSVTGRRKAVGITIQALVDRPLVDLPRRHQRFVLHPNGGVSERSESLQKEKKKANHKLNSRNSLPFSRETRQTRVNLFFFVVVKWLSSARLVVSHK
jgi:hypothetical protein